MVLAELRIENFRCLGAAVLSPAPGLNLVVGANASGKTSLLEAIYLLGRGRSFRAPRLSAVIQNGRDHAIVYARIGADGDTRRVGLRVDGDSSEARIDGQAGVAMAELVAALPVQLIDPQVHDLIQGGPAERRRFVDWGVFHVKHEFMDAWRRFRRAQQQRNAAIRAGGPAEAVAAWNHEFATAGETVDRLRRDYLQALAPVMAGTASEMSLEDAGFVYQSGFPGDSLEAALRDSTARDLAAGTTQVGPHRAEIRLEIEGRAARHRLSRGQQKLLGASLILAQARHLTQVSEKAPVLLVDEPAAELDRAHLRKFFEALAVTPGQAFVTTLDDSLLPIPAAATRFHVEQGKLQTLV